MEKDRNPYLSWLGLAATFTNAQIILPRPSSLAQGTTAGSLMLDLSLLDSSSRQPHPTYGSTSERVQNPMIAFWYRAVFFFTVLKSLSDNRGYIPCFEDFALVISDLGLSLYMLLGRHWNDKAKAEWQRQVGSIPEETPDALQLLEKYFPKLGWDLAKEDPSLWARTKELLHGFYQDVVKHFDEKKFFRSQIWTLATLERCMETARLCWIWSIKKIFAIEYDPGLEVFRDFNRPFEREP